MATTSPRSLVFTFLLFFFVLLGTHQTLGAPHSLSDGSSTEITTDIRECLCTTDTSFCSPEELRKREELCNDDSSSSSAQLVSIISKRDDENSTDTEDDSSDYDYNDDDHPSKTPDVVINRTTTTTPTPTPTPAASQSDGWMLGYPGWTLVLATIVTVLMVG